MKWRLRDVDILSKFPQGILHSEACGGPQHSPAAPLSPSLHNPEFIYQTQVAVGVSGGKTVKVQKNAMLQFVLKLVFWNHLHSFLPE